LRCNGGGGTHTQSEGTEEKFRECLVGKRTDGKELPLRPRRKYGDNIKIDLNIPEREIVDWIHQADGKSQWWILVYKVWINHTDGKI
jgi:hypothetical protein